MPLPLFLLCYSLRFSNIYATLFFRFRVVVLPFRLLLGKKNNIIHIIRHPLFRVSQTLFVLANSRSRFMHIISLPHCLGTNIVYRFLCHTIQSLLKDRRHTKLPLHQISHQHHQIIGKSLIHEQIRLNIILSAAVTFHGRVDFLKEVLVQPASAFCAQQIFRPIPVYRFE